MTGSNVRRLDVPAQDVDAEEINQGTGLVLCSTPNATEAEHQQIAIAIRAVKLGARPPTVELLSKLPAVKARRIYRDVTNRGPCKGQMPTDPSYYISDVNRHFQAAWLAQFYKRVVEGEEQQSQQVECLFKTYEAYLREFPFDASGPTISFDRYHHLIRCVLSGLISMENCRECHCVKLSVKSWDPTRSIKCPVCHLTSAAH